MPEIDNETAVHWHDQLVTLLENKEKSNKELESVYRSMHQVYREIHPQIVEVEDDDIGQHGGEI